MAETNISKILEDCGISSDKINDVMSSLDQMKKKNPSSPAVDLENFEGQVTALKMAMQNETDWRRRASLAAKILSFELDM